MHINQTQLNGKEKACFCGSTEGEEEAKHKGWATVHWWDRLPFKAGGDIPVYRATRPVPSSVTAPLVSPIDSHILFASSCLRVYLYNHNTLEVALKLPSVKPARLSHMRSCVLWCQDCLAWDAVGDVILSNKRTVVPFQHLMKECLVGNGLSASRWLPVSNFKIRSSLGGGMPLEVKVASRT